MTRSGDFVLVCNFLLSSSYLITDRTSAAAAAGSASSGLSEIEVAEDDNKTDCSDQLLDADEGLTEGETWDGRRKGRPGRFLRRPLQADRLHGITASSSTSTAAGVKAHVAASREVQAQEEVLEG